MKTAKELELQKALQAAQDALTIYQSMTLGWVPVTGDLYYFIGGSGRVDVCYRPDVTARMRMAIGNCYQTRALALKAVAYSRVQGLINQACLNIEGDYVPDWSNDNGKKHRVSYSVGEGKWVAEYAYWITSEIHQSTAAKCQQVCDILNDIKLKPVGVEVMNKEQELQKALQAAQDALTAYRSKPAVWVPKSGGEEWHYMVSDRGRIADVCYRPDETARMRMAIGNCYQTKALALKAAEYSRVQGLINQACINVESDYVPDWSNDNGKKHRVSYSVGEGKWVAAFAYWVSTSEIYQSTAAKCQQVCDILNDSKLKPVGVK